MQVDEPPALTVTLRYEACGREAHTSVVFALVQSPKCFLSPFDPRFHGTPISLLHHPLYLPSCNPLPPSGLNFGARHTTTWDPLLSTPSGQYSLPLLLS